MSDDLGVAARTQAARAVHAVLVHGRSLDQVLGEAPLEDSRAQAQVQALAYGTLRWHCRHEVILAELLSRPLRKRDQIIQSLLSLGLFEIFQGHAPGYASVSAAVSATRGLGRPRASGLVNAVLRRAIREQSELLARAIEVDTGRYAHPAWLIEAIRHDWPAQCETILQANQTQAPMCLRVNSLRGSRAGCRERLAAENIASDAPAQFPDALKLVEAKPVMRIPGFDSGDWSVQDAGAQLAARFLSPLAGMRVLDACAAPGGKTSHLLEMASGDLDLLALDIDSARLDRVRESLSRLNLQAELRVADAAKPSDWWDGRLFQRILIDAPCSATGVIRRHPDIRFLRWRKDIANFAKQQSAMLASLWPLLAPGGKLLYVTCSILKAENHAVVAAFLNEQADAYLCELSAEIRALAAPNSGPGLQLLPGSAGTDGFYYALMSKQST